MYFSVQKVSLARRFALVPLGPPLLAYRSNCKAMLSAVDGAVELVVDRPYKAGEPIVVWYVIASPNFPVLRALVLFNSKIEGFLFRCGPQPNSKLLINYGFVDEDNQYDRIVIKVILTLCCTFFICIFSLQLNGVHVSLCPGCSRQLSTPRILNIKKREWLHKEMADSLYKFFRYETFLPMEVQSMFPFC